MTVLKSGGKEGEETYCSGGRRRGAASSLGEAETDSEERGEVEVEEAGEEVEEELWVMGR